MSSQPATDSERLERLLRQEASLREVIELIGRDLGLRPLLTRIAESACRLMEAENGAIGLVDDDRKVVRMEAIFQMPEDELGSEVELGKGLSGTVAKTGRPVIYRSYGEVTDPTRTDLSENAVIGVPIFWHGKLIGTFGLGSSPPRQFTDEDIEVLSHFARHAAIAIENARLHNRAQSALGEMQLLYQTTARLGVALHPDEVVAAYLDQVAAKGRYACTIIEYEFDSAGKREWVVVRGRWDRRHGIMIGNTKFPHDVDQLDDILDQGENVLVEDTETDPRITPYLKELQRRDGNPALAMIPLISSGRRIGLVILTSTKIHKWDEAELRPYLATATYLAIALEHRHEQMSLMTAERQVAVLEDRQRLAHELHDSVTQLLTGINFIAQATAQSYEKNVEEGKKRLDQLSDLSRRALTEMRALLAELAPRESRKPEVEGETIPLVEQLRAHLETMERGEVELRFCAEHYRPIQKNGEHALYRIAQEAVNNAMKYADASLIEVELSSDDDIGTLTVRDNGSGYDHRSEPLEKADSSGLGIPGMRRRATDLGGSFRIHGVSGKGTVVEVKIPRA